jgi:RND family efflux transporter MFP subunit
MTRNYSSKTCLAALLFLAAFASLARAEDVSVCPDTPSYRLDEAQAIDAVLAPRMRVAIAAPLQGLVDEIRVEIGDRVAQGDVLLQIDPAKYRIEWERAGADLEAARAESAAAEIEVAQAKERAARFAILGKKRLVSEEAGNETAFAVERTSALLRRAQAKVKALEAEHKHAHLVHERSIVRAPVRARVAKRTAAVGEYVDAGHKLLELVSEEAEVRLFAPLSVLTHLKQSRCLGLLVEESSQRLLAKVRAIAPEMDATTGEVAVIAELLEPLEMNDRLRYGSRLRLFEAF